MSLTAFRSPVNLTAFVPPPGEASPFPRRRTSTERMELARSIVADLDERALRRYAEALTEHALGDADVLERIDHERCAEWLLFDVWVAARSAHGAPWGES